MRNWLSAQHSPVLAGGCGSSLQWGTLPVPSSPGQCLGHNRGSWGTLAPGQASQRSGEENGEPSICGTQKVF